MSQNDRLLNEKKNHSVSIFIITHKIFEVRTSHKLFSHIITEFIQLDTEKKNYIIALKGSITILKHSTISNKETPPPYFHINENAQHSQNVRLYLSIICIAGNVRKISHFPGRISRNAAPTKGHANNDQRTSFSSTERILGKDRHT